MNELEQKTTATGYAIIIRNTDTLRNIDQNARKYDNVELEAKRWSI